MSVKKALTLIFSIVVVVSIFGIVTKSISDLIADETVGDFTGLTAILYVVPIVALVAILYKLGIFDMFSGRKDR